MATPKLLDLLALDEDGFRRRFRSSPVQRAKRRGLLRNVCVALGNWGDPVAVPGLVEVLNDSEPLIRGHAAWALGRIAIAQRAEDRSQIWQAMNARQTTETDPFVRHEIVRALDSNPEHRGLTEARISLTPDT